MCAADHYVDKQHIVCVVNSMGKYKQHQYPKLDENTYRAYGGLKVFQCGIFQISDIDL